MRGYSENVCPNCGNIVPIRNDKKVDVCMACGEWVGNDGWYGYAHGKTDGCATAIGILIAIFAIPVLLIGCAIGL